MTEADLRARGFRVFTRHLRYFIPINNKTRVMSTQMPAQFSKKTVRGQRPWPRGGITEVRLVWPDGTETMGVAYCSPKDNYDKRVGRQMALEAALLAEWSGDAKTQNPGQHR